MAAEKVYTAEYQGSGTFIISKPKRKKAKMRQTALKNPEVVEKLRGVGLTTASGQSAELARMVPAEHERIGKLIKTANIKPEG